MLNPSKSWIEQIKYIVREMVNQRQFVLEGVVTSVDPNPPYKVKVNLEPYGIETGWLLIGMPLTGAGYGVVLPPPDEGTAVKVIFDMGDLSNGTVIASMYSDSSSVPNVPVGTMGLYHKSGSSISIGTDGTVTIKGKTTTQTF